MRTFDFYKYDKKNDSFKNANWKFGHAEILETGDMKVYVNHCLANTMTYIIPADYFNSSYSPLWSPHKNFGSYIIRETFNVSENIKTIIANFNPASVN